MLLAGVCTNLDARDNNSILRGLTRICSRSSILFPRLGRFRSYSIFQPFLCSEEEGQGLLLCYCGLELILLQQ